MRSACRYALARLIGRATCLSVAYTGPGSGSARSLIRIRVCFSGVLRRALVLILGSAIGGRNLSILHIGRRPSRAPVTLLAGCRRLL